jgi:hypothetical protein
MDGRWKEFIFYQSGQIFKSDWNTGDDDNGHGNDNSKNNNTFFLKLIIALFARGKEGQLLR